MTELSNDVELLKQYIQIEQEILWDNLANAILHSHDGIWSLACESLLCRITHAIQLVGPTSHLRVQWFLLAGGIYSSIVELSGKQPEPISDSDWLLMEEQMKKYGGTLRDLQKKYVLTLAAIRKEFVKIYEGGYCYGYD